MKHLRIALCGPNVETNEWLREQIGLLISPFNDSPQFMQHPLSALINRTKKVDWTKNIDEMNLYSNVWRALDQIRYEEEEVLISSSCGIDCVSLQAAWLAEQAMILEQKTKLLGVDGQQLVTHDHIKFNKSGAILQSILNQAEEEAMEFWDFIYAIIPASSSLIQHTSNDILAQYEDFLSSVPAFADVIRLPDNRTSALDALQQEVEKWKTQIGSSS